MNTSLVALNPKVLFPQAVPTVLPQAKVDFQPEVQPSPKYLENSDFYEMRGGFSAEVIQNPAVKFMEHGIFSEVMQELKDVTLAAFGKDAHQAETYTPDSVMRKNVILVDWLTVVRKGSKIVAYTSGSFINNDVFYIHATMVLPEYQKYAGLGIVPNIYMWHKLIQQRIQTFKPELKLVCRTRNKSVVSLLSHVWMDMFVSGDPRLSEAAKALFSETANIVEDESYDEKTGICLGIYPDALPSGELNKHIKRFEGVFSRLGECDAVYVAGVANELKFEQIMNKEIVRKQRKVKIEFVVGVPMAVAA